MAGALVAGVGAGAAAWLLAAGSQHEVLVSNSAGAVTTRDGLALWWAEGGRLGVVPAAALLVGLVWLAAVLVHDVRWHDAWRDVLAVLVVPGVVLTVLAGIALWWLLSGWSIPVATWLLLPLLGTELLLVAAGVPISVAVPRLTAGPVEWSTWSQGAAVALAGLGAAVLWAVSAGAWRARRRDPGVPTAAAAALSGAACGLFALALAAAGPSASFPAGLGGEGMLGVPPLAAGLAGLASRRAVGAPRHAVGASSRTSRAHRSGCGRGSDVTMVPEGVS